MGLSRRHLAALGRAGSYQQRTEGAARRKREREQPEQERVVRALDAAGVLFCSVPNGGGRSQREAAALQRAGVRAGVPDLVLWDAPPAHPGKVGTVLEMKAPDLAPKTERAGRWSGARPEQREWLAALDARGWLALVAYGADDALRKLRAAGYDVAPRVEVTVEMVGGEG